MNTKSSGSNIPVITKVLILLYLLVPLSPFVVTMEYEAFQWLYISVLNIVTGGYLIKNKAFFNSFRISKQASRFFIICIAFFLIACISMFLSIFIVESLVHLSRLFNSIVAVFCFYTIIRQFPKKYVVYIAQVMTVLLLFYSFKTFGFIIENYASPRTISLKEKFGHLHKFGNINIYTAWSVMSLSFAFLLFFYSNKLWKYVAGFTIAATYIALLFSGSRTALLSLSIITLIILAYTIFRYLKTREKKDLLPLGFMVVVPFIAVLFVLNANKIHSKKMNSLAIITQYYPDNYRKIEKILRDNKDIVTSTVKLSPEEKSATTLLLKKTGRYEIWRSAAQMFKEHPFLGVGYGNYQVHSKGDFFKRKVDKRYRVPRRVHNDFLEKFVETGIIGGLLYLAIFLFLLWSLYKIYKKNTSIPTVFLLTVFLLGIVYVLDATFNFPLERVPTQLFFIVFAACILAIYSETKKKEEQNQNNKSALAIGTGVMIVLAFTILSNYKTFTTYKELILVSIDVKNKPLFSDKKYSKKYNEVKDALTGYVVKSPGGGFTNLHLALYAINAGNYDLALTHTDMYRKKDIDGYEVMKLKAQIYLEGLKNIDSAEYYAKKVYHNFPSFYDNYELLKSVHLQRKDTASFVRLMQDYIHHSYKDVNEWVKIANIKNNKGKNIEDALKILDTAIAYNKDNLSDKYKLIEAKHTLLNYKSVNSHIEKKEIKAMYNEVVALYKAQKFKECKAVLHKLLKIEPNDHFGQLYLGITEMQLRNHEIAIKLLTKVIDKKVFTDGKAEFCRGYCYEQLKDLERSKKDYAASRAKGFAQALQLPKEKYE